MPSFLESPPVVPPEEDEIRPISPVMLHPEGAPDVAPDFDPDHLSSTIAQQRAAAVDVALELQRSVATGGPDPAP